MRAMVYSEYGALPTLQEVPEPHCPADGVVVAVEATGVCRSDWHAWMGHDPVALPHVPGHELAGTIAEVGPDVTRWRVGDRVTVPFACGCGTCLVCRAGNSQVCPNQTQPGFTHWGSFADRVALHAADSNLIALPDTVSAVDAAALGCRFATAFGALVGRGRLASGEWLVVHGVGGVGLSAVMIGMALGARVVAVDVSPAALDQAGELGAEVVIRTTDKDDPTLVARQVIDATEGGAHVTIDAFGSTATALASIGGLRQRGRHVQVGLLLAADAVLPVAMGPVVARELEILGSHGLAAAGYPPMMDLLASGALDPGRLVGQVIGLDEAGRALAELGSPGRPPGLTVVRLR
ncbi:MAG: zinc-dependent alcohol dehydrogenase family protein [Dermatophilaceae bacterium]